MTQGGQLSSASGTGHATDRKAQEGDSRPPAGNSQATGEPARRPRIPYSEKSFGDRGQAASGRRGPAPREAPGEPRAADGAAPNPESARSADQAGPSAVARNHLALRARPRLRPWRGALTAEHAQPVRRSSMETVFTAFTVNGLKNRRVLEESAETSGPLTRARRPPGHRSFPRGRP